MRRCYQRQKQREKGSPFSSLLLLDERESAAKEEGEGGGKRVQKAEDEIEREKHASASIQEIRKTCGKGDSQVEKWV